MKVTTDSSEKFNQLIERFSISIPFIVIYVLVRSTSPCLDAIHAYHSLLIADNIAIQVVRVIQMCVYDSRLRSLFARRLMKVIPTRRSSPVICNARILNMHKSSWYIANISQNFRIRFKFSCTNLFGIASRGGDVNRENCFYDVSQFSSRN